MHTLQVLGNLGDTKASKAYENWISLIWRGFSSSAIVAHWYTTNTFLVGSTY